MDEHDYEKLLNIKSAGEQKDFNASAHYNRYEPTAYAMLDALTEQYPLAADDCVVDFGSGKGRLSFYLNHRVAAAVSGIEMNAFFHQQALANKQSYHQQHKKRRKCDNLTFLHCLAEDYAIQPTDNVFYFFNPFSLQIFTAVVANILRSVEDTARRVDIVLHYPSYEYIDFLETGTPFQFLREVPSPQLYDADPRNRFVIYRLEAVANTP